MGYTDQINDTKGISELMAMALDVQNKGLATVMFDVHGHVNQTSIDFYVPAWNRNERPTFKIEFYNDRVNGVTKAKSELQAFIIGLPELAEKIMTEKAAKELADKRAQFEALKAELEQSTKAA